MMPLLILLLALALPPLAHTATYYVATSGSDGAPCTEAQPCATMTQAATHMQAGDTLYLRSGTYSETISAATRLPSGTSWAQPVTVAGSPGEAVTLTGGINLYYPPEGSASLAYAIFDNFHIIGHAGYGVLGPNVHHIRLSNSERTGAPGGAGVGAGYGTHHLEFINLHVHHNGPTRASDASGNPGSPGGHGFYVCGQFMLIRGNDIHDNGNYGLQIYDSNNIGCADDSVIEDNHIHDNHTGDGAATINYGSRVRILRNRVSNNQGDGIAVTYGHPDGVLLCGNTITDNTGTAISIGSGVTNTVLRGNVLARNSRDLDDRGTGTITEGSSGDCPAPTPGPAPTPPAPKRTPVVTNLRQLR